MSVKQAQTQTQITGDYLIVTLPATIVRRIPFTPSLPSQQHDAFATLRYGRATKTLLQFSKRFWHAAGRPRAFGSPFDFGALMDANEEQRGRPGILALLAGGGASDATQAIVAKDGPVGLIHSLEFLGSKQAELLASRQVVWEHDPWARGGYAFFDPSTGPRAPAVAAGGAAVLRRRAHQHPLAGLHERRDRERTARRRRNRRGPPALARSTKTFSPPRR